MSEEAKLTRTLERLGGTSDYARSLDDTAAQAQHQGHDHPKSRRK